MGIEATVQVAGDLTAWRDAAVRFRASEKRRADVEDEEWHQRYGLWYRHP